MHITHKTLFLIDSAGALLSAFLLGVVLVHYENFFGMPRAVLYPLSIIACVFAVYSFTCYLSVKKNAGIFLKIIGIANLLYCCVTIGLLVKWYTNLSIAGVVYFAMEIIVILALARFELQKAVAKGNP